MRRRNTIAQRYLFCVIGIVAAVLASAGPAFGQFIIQPMRMEIPAAPGQRVIQGLQLQNHAADDTVAVDLAVTDLTQEENGGWLSIEPDANNFDTSKLASCRQWISLSNDTVSVKPVTIETVGVIFTVPPGIRGVYSAAITVSLKSAAELKQPGLGLGISLQFLVPVIVHIQGAPPLRKVEMTDLGLEFYEATELTPSRTLMSMTVANKGGTYSRLRGRLTTLGHFKDHWRILTERDVTTVGILPGSELKLASDIGRSLPPGKYKVRGALMVDGQRAGSFEKDIDFAGDPSVAKVATDAPLNLSPSEIVINGLPGATRATAVQVVNTSDEAVNVRAAVALPPVLKGVAIGTYKGEDLNCTHWLEVLPKEFHLPSYGRQSIRIVVKMPNPEAVYPCYYAIVGLFATYPDGQNAGLTTANVCVVNQQAEAKPMARATGALNLSLEKESQYSVTCVFGNYGNIHFTPERCRATVRNLAGLPMLPILLRGRRDLMLPFEFREFSGVLDFSEFPAGFYRVEVSLGYGPSLAATSDVGIEVSIEGERRVVTTLGQEEFQQKIGVKWR